MMRRTFFLGAAAVLLLIAHLAIPSGAFRVARRESTPGADIDLVATSAGVYCNTAVIPLFTILSLGIVPTVWEEEDCEGMILRSVRIPAAPPVQVDVRVSGRAMMG
jgi:hypothetical protein